MKKRYLYKISQNVNTDYDFYSCAIVCAENEEQAKRFHPDGDVWDEEYKEFLSQSKRYPNWASNLDDVNVTKIGTADKDVEIGVVASSFNVIEN